MRTFLVILIAFAAKSATAADSGPVVSVTGGQIRGAMLDRGGAVFKGIAFAQPPVGKLRWREPMPVKPWTGVRNTTAFGSPCVQSPNVYAPGAGEISQEDCLYLNVWTPGWPPRAKRSVMVWIHGGGNVANTASQDLFDGESLTRHDVVVVTVNYRLGTFGFFAHPELSKESAHHTSGNQGILDQIAALRWVRANIGTFGGDPGNITIFGESAGSFDVNALMASPLTKGLFQRAIGESGAVVGLGAARTLRVAEERGTAFGSKLRAPSLQNLRAVPAAKILQETEPNNLNDLESLRVIVDGYVLADSPARVFAAGREHRVSLILGNNSRDLIGAIPTDLRKAIDQKYGPLASRAADLYGVAGTEPLKDDFLYGTPIQQWVVDTSLRCGAVAELVWHVATGNKAFEYEFVRVPAGREAVGATHASELSYVFGSLDKVGVRGAGPVAEVAVVDRQVSEVMQQYWTNFAKTGDPNGGGLPAWPKFDVASRGYIQFNDTGPTAKEGLRRPFCDLFTENVRREIVH